MRTCSLMVLTVIIAACTGTARPATMIRADPDERSMSVLPRTEILNHRRHGTLLDVVRELRPHFTTVRRGGLRVYVDNIAMADGIHALQRIPVDQVAEVRLLSGSEATTRLGTGHMNGAILVRLHYGARQEEGRR